MAKKCYFCGKSSMIGNKVSKSNNRTRRRFKPNLQKVTIEVDGQKKKVFACTKCIKAGKTITY
ncbi:MAG TPA: 50S ribosomal protein L28 [Candidatus Mcinerneyibacterium sp.]|nr:50S ribosomal protein L28 [Candidatus Mcinerneyibacterium sp.]